MIIVFDIGGTHMRVATSNDGATLGVVKEAPTPQDFGEGVQQLAVLARECAAGGMITAVAGGVPGVLNLEKNALIHAPHLPQWDGQPLKKKLENELVAPVTLENDAALAALGEATHGAGKGKRIVAYLTVGTGVGGARIVDGEIDANAFGFEPGHQIVGNGMTLEQCVSGSGIRARYGKAAEEITDAAVWNEAAQWLAEGIYNSMVHWSPDIVVLGGSVPAHKFSCDDLAARAATMPFSLPKTPIVPAALGDNAGLYGAIMYAQSV
ncbi:MAG: ROK family protein [Patescibacteria group bacterium]